MPTPFGYSDGIDAGGQQLRLTRSGRRERISPRAGRTPSRRAVGFPEVSAGGQYHRAHRRRRRRARNRRHVLLVGPVLERRAGRRSSGGPREPREAAPSARTSSAIRSGTPSGAGPGSRRGVDVAQRRRPLPAGDCCQSRSGRKDIPINYMLLDNEKATAWNFELTGAGLREVREVPHHAERGSCARASCRCSTRGYRRSTSGSLCRCSTGPL